MPPLLFQQAHITGEYMEQTGMKGSKHAATSQSFASREAVPETALPLLYPVDDSAATC